MFEWIKTMTDCPKLSAAQYPKIDQELQALYDQAIRLTRSDGIIDQVEIAALYQKAAEQGHWPSMHNLAVRYYQGNGVEEDDQQARYWYEQMASYDIPDGYTAMATVYFKGIGVEKDTDKALGYMDKAAQLGDPDAQFMVGRYLFSPLNRFEESKIIMACAMEQGHKEAAFELALHYKVDEDFQRAYQTYRKGAKLGSESCINALADAYAHTPKYQTFGLTQDVERAICLERLVEELDENPELTFPDLDQRCPANVKQPPGRD